MNPVAPSFLRLLALALPLSAQEVLLVGDNQDANGTIVASRPAVAYDETGNFWVKTGDGTNSTGWTKIVASSFVPAIGPCLTFPETLTLRNQSRIQMDHLVSGRSDTSTQWEWFTGSGVNSNCWVKPLDFSGISMLEATGQTISLVTRKHGITCAHSTPGIGSETMFVGSDGSLCTNWVSSIQISSNDLCVVTFSNDFPNSVKPFSILPTNYLAYGDLGWTLTPVVAEALYYRANTHRMDVRMVFQWNATGGLVSLMDIYLGWQPPVFNEPVVTSGDSGSPAFLILDSAPVFLFATHLDAPLGPMVSYPGRLEWIQAVCGTNYPLAIMDLTRYPKP